MAEGRRPNCYLRWKKTHIKVYYPEYEPPHTEVATTEPRSVAEEKACSDEEEYIVKL